MSHHSFPSGNSLSHRSSLRRKSMLTRSGGDSRILFQNDDDAERRELRRNVELEVRQREGAQPTSDKRSPVGTVLAELSATQLAEHYANCIKLSAENKITVKNAFSLQLIDYMAMMLKKRDSTMDNFQVASCTLDASTKIYAYRVDSVHTDVLKMAGGLAVGTCKKQAKENEDGTGEEPAEGAETVRIKRKPRKAKSTVATNVESINGKLDLNHDMDPFFIHSAGSLSDCQPGDCHFLAGLKMSSNYALALDSSLPYWCQGTRSEFADMKVPLPAFPDFKNKTICPTFEEFTISNWSLEKEADTLTPPAAAAALPPVDDDYVFDVNAPPEPIPEPKPVDVEPEHFEIAGIDDDQDSEDEEEVAPTCQVKQSRPPAIVNLRKHLSLTPREYSYFRAGALDLWAGPSRWKPKQYRDRGTSTEEQNKNGTASTAIAKQKKVKKPMVLEFNNMAEVLRKTEKSGGLAVRLSRHTLKKWAIEGIDDPLDEFYDLSSFSQLEFHTLSVISLPTSDDDDDTEVDTPAYNYDNNNDAEEYCPNVVEDNHDDYCEQPVGPDGVPLPVPLPVPLQDVHNATTQMATLDGFAGDNLVPPPSKVSRVVIPYATQAKKMDMKRLKQCIWNLLTESDSAEEPAESNLRVENAKKFSCIYSQLPSKLSGKMAENLSPHLAICALLHLANEKNLILTDQEDLSDLIITQF